jgi:hypothetical protein
MPLGWALAGSAVAGLIGSGMQASAVQSAAQTQADAARAAAEQQRQMFDIIQKQQQPYRQTGYSGLNVIGSMLPGQQPQYDDQGNLTGTQAGTGYLTQQFGPEQLKSSLAPNYQFMLQQGLGATSQAMNPSGGGSNIERARQKFAEDYASNAYQNAFQNFQTQQTNIYNRLASVAGLGQASLGQTTPAATQTAGNIGQAMIGAGSAQAAGQVGAANAIAGGLQNLGNTGFLYNLLRPTGGGAGSQAGVISGLPEWAVVSPG